MRFVRVDKIVPEKLRPFSDLTTAVVNTHWYPVSDSGGGCADVTVLGDAKTAPRTVLPPTGRATSSSGAGDLPRSAMRCSCSATARG